MGREDRVPRLYGTADPFLMKYDEQSVLNALDAHARAGRIEGWTRRDSGKIALSIKSGGLWVGTIGQAHHLCIGLMAGSNHERQLWQQKTAAARRALE